MSGSGMLLGDMGCDVTVGEFLSKFCDVIVFL